MSPTNRKDQEILNASTNFTIVLYDMPYTFPSYLRLGRILNGLFGDEGCS